MAAHLCIWLQVEDLMIVKVLIDSGADVNARMQRIEWPEFVTLNIHAWTLKVLHR